MATKEYTNDDAAKVATGATKFDGGKVGASQGLIQRFPRALRAVGEISTFGKNKYGTWAGWESVDDAVNRYSDAMMRHILYEAEGEEFDPDSGLRHAAHAAWNALATLELKIRQAEKMNVAKAYIEETYLLRHGDGVGTN